MVRPYGDQVGGPGFVCSAWRAVRSGAAADARDRDPAHRMDARRSVTSTGDRPEPTASSHDPIKIGVNDLGIALDNHGTGRSSPQEHQQITRRRTQHGLRLTLARDDVDRCVVCDKAKPGRPIPRPVRLDGRLKILEEPANEVARSLGGQRRRASESKLNVVAMYAPVPGRVPHLLAERHALVEQEGLSMLVARFDQLHVAHQRRRQLGKGRRSGETVTLVKDRHGVEGGVASPLDPLTHGQRAARNVTQHVLDRPFGTGRNRGSVLGGIQRQEELDVLSNGLNAAFFAAQSSASWPVWISPHERDAYRWFDAELANLRAAFRWAADHGHLDTAATIAVTAAYLGFFRLSPEAAGWCEELVPIAEQTHHRLLRWLYAGAGTCCLAGRPGDAMRYGEAALALADDPAMEPFPEESLTVIGQMLGYLFSGRPEDYLPLMRHIIDTTADELAVGRTSEVWILATMGRYDEAIALAENMLAAAVNSPVPTYVAYGYSAYGKAYTHADPTRALAAHRTAVQLTRAHGNRVFEAAFSRDLASIEATNGDRAVALISFERTLDALHQAGDIANLTATLAHLVVFFTLTDRTSEAATLAAAIAHRPEAAMVPDLDTTRAQLHHTPDPATLARCEQLGAHMTLGDATRFARDTIHHAQTISNDT